VDEAVRLFRSCLPVVDAGNYQVLRDLTELTEFCEEAGDAHGAERLNLLAVVAADVWAPSAGPGRSGRVWGTACPPTAAATERERRCACSPRSARVRVGRVGGDAPSSRCASRAAAGRPGC
jgi:hypothetical protein